MKRNSIAALAVCVVVLMALSACLPRPFLPPPGHIKKQGAPGHLKKL